MIEYVAFLVLCVLILIVVVAIYSDRRDRIARLQSYADITGTTRLKGESLSVWEDLFIQFEESIKQKLKLEHAVDE